MEDCDNVWLLVGGLEMLMNLGRAPRVASAVQDSLKAAHACGATIHGICVLVGDGDAVLAEGDLVAH